MEPQEAVLPYWLDMKQVCEITQLSLSTLKRRCAAGEIAPNCGRRFGRVWRFKREVILNEGLIFLER